MIHELLMTMILGTVGFLVYLQLSQRKYLRLLGSLLMEESKHTAEKMANLQSEISEAQKKLDTVGKILNIYEQQTKILQKHREEVQKIQSRFQKREVR